MIKTVVFDLGNTLIRQRVDDEQTLDEMDLEPIEGASEMLRKLHGGYRIGLLSNTTQSRETHVRSALHRLGWGALFDCVVTSMDTGYEKPAPEMFRQVLARLESEPQHAVMVGNDLEADMLGGRLIGIHTVFFSCNPSDWAMLRRFEPKPDHVLSRLADLEGLLTELNSAAGRQTLH